MIFCEQLDGIAWVAAHDPDTGMIAVAPALPEWASPGLAAAWEGDLLASAAGRCPECKAVSHPVPDGQPPAAAGALVHSPACPLSPESITRLEEACRPPGRRWIADAREETTDAVAAYCADLAENLARSAAAREGGPQ